MRGRRKEAPAVRLFAGWIEATCFALDIALLAVRVNIDHGES
jgi:hypothetical protein